MPKTKTPMTYTSYVFSSYVSKDDKNIIEKKIAVENKNGVVSGNYEEKKNGKVVKTKSIKNEKDVLTLL